MSTNETIAVWAGLDMSIPWPCDTDIALWHGPDGLLAKIKERGETFIAEFVRRLDDHVAYVQLPETTYYSGMWQAVQATPAELSLALAEVIDDE